MLARKVWGNGYMKEALTAVFQYAKQELRLLELRADIDERNVRSVHLFLALGFRQDSKTLYTRKL